MTSAERCYRVKARDAASMLGWTDAVEQLEEMSVKEDRHERWFGDRIRDHRLLPIARALLTWTPPAPLPPDESASGLADHVPDIGAPRSSS